MKGSILLFVKHYLPGTKFGGPVQSISNLVEWLGDDYDFKIITLDRDFLSTVSYRSIDQNEWNRVGKADVYYITPSKMTFINLWQILKSTEYDILYLNSFFDPSFTLIPLVLEKLFLTKNPNTILLAPRGEISQGALAHKTIKKKSYLKCLNRIGLSSNINWHATDKIEKDDIQSELSISDDKIFISPNLPSKGSENIEIISNKNEGTLRIIYLSRITPKKNLDYVLDLCRDINEFEIIIDLYGTIDDKSYWNICLKKIEVLPKNITVEQKGHIAHDDVLKTISRYDLFILPTKNENFGHAIIESILAGTPVLISKNTPWTDLDSKGVGWDFELKNVYSFKNKIRELAKLNADQMSVIKKKVKNNYDQVINKNALKDTKMMYQKILRVNG